MAKKKQTQPPISQHVVYENKDDGFVVVQDHANGIRYYASSKFVWVADFKDAWLHEDRNRANQIQTEMRKFFRSEEQDKVKVAKIIRSVRLEVLS